MLTPSDQKSSLFRQKSRALKEHADFAPQTILGGSKETIYMSDFAGDRVDVCLRVWNSAPCLDAYALFVARETVE
jgi:hypothetical protein